MQYQQPTPTELEQIKAALGRLATSRTRGIVCCSFCVEVFLSKHLYTFIVALAGFLSCWSINLNVRLTNTIKNKLIEMPKYRKKKIRKAMRQIEVITWLEHCSLKVCLVCLLATHNHWVRVSCGSAFSLGCSRVPSPASESNRTNVVVAGHDVLPWPFHL
jgi:hypothetical protein